VERPSGWIWVAAFRIARGELANRPIGSSNEVLERPQLVDGPQPTPLVVELLEQLSHSQRAALVLHHYAGFPTHEVAEMIGSTPAAVRVPLMRGRRRMRSLLAADTGIGLATPTPPKESPWPIN